MTSKYFFRQGLDGTYRTNHRNIVRAFHWFKANPEGEIATGSWPTETWSFSDFRQWFKACLAKKTSPAAGKSWRCLSDDWQIRFWNDARTIRQARKGIRQSGRNLLRTIEMQRRFPSINSYMPEC